MGCAHAVYDASMTSSPLAATTIPPDPETPRAAGPVVRQARAWALGLLLALIVLGLAWELWLAPTGSGSLAVKVVPLVLCLAGLWRHRMYTFRWLSLLVWLYFTEGVVRATSEGGVSRLLAVAEVVLTVALFAVCAFYIRWRLRQGAAQARALAAADEAARRPGTVADA
jgi:uncharacterized membrane protein